MSECLYHAPGPGLYTRELTHLRPGDRPNLGSPQGPTQPFQPPTQPTPLSSSITSPSNHQHTNPPSHPFPPPNTMSPTNMSDMFTPYTSDMITSTNPSTSEMITPATTPWSTVPLSFVNTSPVNFPPSHPTDPSPRVLTPSPSVTHPDNSPTQTILPDPPTFTDDPSYSAPPPPPIQTTQMSFHWPENSSPERTRSFIEQAGGKLPSINIQMWTYYLRDHPDRLLVDNVIRGLQEGFPVGFTGPRLTVEAPDYDYDNSQLDQIIREFDHEVSLGRMAGPFNSLPTTGPYKHFHRIHPTFLIPKKNSTKMRRIEHISWPPGESVNDGIRKEDFPVSFTSVEALTEAILERTPGTYVSSYDITDAYRHLMIHPRDCPLFCFHVKDRFYLQLRIGFGCRSAPGTFDTVSDLVAWILIHHSKIPGYEDSGIQRAEVILDDYNCFHSDRSRDDPVLRELEHERVLELFKELGLPLASHKIQPPSTVFNAIGCVWDTIEQSVSIPHDKLQRYKRKIDKLVADEDGLFSYEQESNLKSSVGTIRSLCGCLVYICNICYTGRSRLYHIFKCLRASENAARRRFGKAADTMKTFPGRWNVVHLNRDAIHDLRWWQSILPDFPCRLLLRRRLDPQQLGEIPTFTTDASGWGVGGWFQSNTGQFYFFSIPYSKFGHGCHSTYGELLAATVAVALWDHEWKFQHVRWVTDCQPHIHGLFKIRTRAPHLLPLHDFLDMRSALGGYQYAPSHLAGDLNTIADQLSRNIIEVPRTWVRCHPTTNLLPSSFGGKLEY